MKNLTKIFLIGFGILTMLSIKAEAQKSYFVSAANGSTLDTVTNTAVKTQTIRIPGYQDILTIQVNLTNISGTNAGVVRLFGSADGVNYVRIPTYTSTNSVAIDSLTAETNNMIKIFRLPVHAYSNYKVTYTGTGTMAVQMQSLAIYSKR